MKCDFSGYATKNDLLCSDGRTIRAGAFAAQDKQKVPLVWRHKSEDLENVLGHVYLENRPDGMYCYANFNDSARAKEAKIRVEHDDLDQMSIWANELVQQGGDVMHGTIREVSLVLAGANPGAVIDNVSFKHDSDFSEELESSGVIYPGLGIEHEQMADDKKEDDTTIEDVFHTMNDDQKNLLYYLVNQASGGDLEHEDSDEDNSDDESKDKSDDEDPSDDSEDETIEHEEKDNKMPRNAFEQGSGVQVKEPRLELSHDQMKAILSDAQELGSLEKGIMAHANEYGITNIDMLFPEANLVRNTPDWVKRRTEWVSGVLSGVHKSPFSRIKSRSADITLETARAKGYVKGNLKKEEFFALKQRITTPTTIYKKQKLDRDDIIDITDFDVVMWIKAEMRVMLEEELARAILFGDGRDVASEDKIKDPASLSDGAGIRSIANEHDFYAHQVTVPADATPAQLEELILRSRTKYKGSGAPTFYTSEDTVTDLLLQKDKMDRRLYKTVDEVAAATRVSSIVPIELMDSYPNIVGIEVNLADYTLGADKGGETTFFDDFDIDYNQYKYLYETRLSGALTLPKSAIVFKKAAAAQG